jgi:hypothetical protein
MSEPLSPEEQQILDLLRVVRDGDEANALVDNAILATRLGWKADVVATCLQIAKDRKLVWGNRTGDAAKRWFTELEVTVQGRRLLKQHAATDPGPPAA